ncbi:MAG: anti-sigma factor antagonist [Clostridium sp.]|nr:anti-sigma factor antagonist [Clostridium sp.]
MFSFDMKKNGTDVVVTLAGRLDGVVAPKLHEEMSTIYGEEITSITFEAKDLEYISSAGLRVIVFVKQKLGDKVRLCLKDASAEIRSVMELTGFSNFVEMI